MHVHCIANYRVSAFFYRYLFASARTVLLCGSIFSGAVRAPELLAMGPVRSCRGSITDGAFGAIAERFPIGFFFFFVGRFLRAGGSFAG